MYKIVSIGLVAILCSGTVAEAKQANARTLNIDNEYWMSVDFGTKSAVPSGYYNLCVRGNSVCVQTRTGGLPENRAGAVRLTAALRAQLDQVNASVNHTMRPVADRRDVWSVGTAKGDCEDFALTKKKKLMDLGWPTSALLMALAWTKSGEEHAVLIVRTDHGDLVLDILRPDIREWSASLYRWESIQSPTDTWAWYQVGNGRLAMQDPADQDAPVSMASLLTTIASKMQTAIEKWLAHSLVAAWPAPAAVNWAGPGPNEARAPHWWVAQNQPATSEWTTEVVGDASPAVAGVAFASAQRG